MSNFSVAHIRKIKTSAGSIQIIKHNLRKKDNLETFIDISKSYLNVYNGATDENFLIKYEEFTANLSRKIQRNASRLIEIVFSFSPEFSEGWEDNPELKRKIDDYFNKSEAFLKARYGDVIICRADHFDEKTPHSHFLLVPICVDKDGKKKFSSSEFLGGKKGFFDFHDKFHAEVGVHFGLERGVRDSRTPHSDLKSYNDWEQSQRLKLEQKEKDIDSRRTILLKQQEEIEENRKQVEFQQKTLLNLNNDVMKRSAQLSKLELEIEELEKIQDEKVPEIPLPPASITENPRKKWRDEIQHMVNMAFNKMKDVVLSFKVKYDNLLEKYLKLVALNKKNINRAEKAEKDLAEKPIEDIIADRKKLSTTVPDQKHGLKQGRVSL